MAKLRLIVLFFLVISCDKSNDCIDESQITDFGCAMDYNPVCGCDQVTYPNACMAGNAGVKRWTEGECDN
jgi:hypothetical protein